MKEKFFYPNHRWTRNSRTSVLIFEKQDDGSFHLNGSVPLKTAIELHGICGFLTRNEFISTGVSEKEPTWCSDCDGKGFYTSWPHTTCPTCTGNGVERNENGECLW